MYFLYRDGKYIDMAGKSFRKFLAREIPEVKDIEPTMADWADHLTTIFPEVRLKRFIEMRGSDSGPTNRLPALPAFWVGLVYDDTSLDAAWDLVKSWTAEQRQTLRDDVPKLGFKARIGDRSVLELAKASLEIARAGLKRRARLDREGDDETQYLDTLDDFVARKITPADELLEKFHGPWKGSVDPVFDEYAY
jgi:glutamate--cysteine ligase